MPYGEEILIISAINSGKDLANFAVDDDLYSFNFDSINIKHHKYSFIHKFINKMIDQK
jgi:hypothetical protein